MTRQPHIARRAEELLGSSVVATAPVAGGDIATATKLRLSSGRSAFMKTLTNAPAGFFEAEAAGLRWLGEAGGVQVPDVLAVEADCLVLSWVEPGQAHDRGGHRLRPGAGQDPRRRRTGVRARPRRVHRPAAAAQQGRPDVGRVLRDPAAAALPQARP